MKIVLLFFLLIAVIPTIAQEEKSLGKAIDDLTYAWDRESQDLMEYEGMVNFCSNKEYRIKIIGMLQDIHHYDSVLYKRLSKAVRFTENKEIKKTLEDIEEFEQEYSMQSFINYLYKECQLIYELETNKEDLQDEITSESYDGKVYIIETELRRYIKHITKRVDLIREHVHHLHIR